MTEKMFILDGLTQQCRIDGRELKQVRQILATPNILISSLGSASIEYADGKKIQSAITAEICATPVNNIYVESISQSDASVKQKIMRLLKEYIQPYLPKLMINQKKGWLLNIDLLAYSPLHISDLDYITIAIKQAFKTLEIPQLSESKNQLTGETQLDMVDQLVKIDESECPTCVTVGVHNAKILVHDLSEEERNYIDSVAMIFIQKGEVVGVETDGEGITKEVLMEAIKAALSQQ